MEHPRCRRLGIFSVVGLLVLVMLVYIQVIWVYINNTSAQIKLISEEYDRMEERHSLLSTAKLVLENNMILIPIESQVVGLSENQALTPSASPTSMTSTPMVFKNNEDPEYVTSSLEINRLISDLKGDLKQQNKLLKAT
jgi:hypothetical protein